jgi:hypothetical protein
MTPADVAVRRRLMLSMHAELLADVAEVMQCDVEICADELASTFRGDRSAYLRAIVEEIERRFKVPSHWTAERLAAYRKVLDLEAGVWDPLVV